jgi:hypothetical protein
MSFYERVGDRAVLTVTRELAMGGNGDIHGPDGVCRNSWDARTCMAEVDRSSAEEDGDDYVLHFGCDQVAVSIIGWRETSCEEENIRTHAAVLYTKTIAFHGIVSRNPAFHAVTLFRWPRQFEKLLSKHSLLLSQQSWVTFKYYTRSPNLCKGKPFLFRHA